MKCSNCGSEMTEWQRSKHSDHIEIRYRCEVCGSERDEKIDLYRPKPVKEK